MARRRLGRHHRSHEKGGSDEIRGLGDGIKFDTDNEGDWFFGAVNDPGGGPNGYGWQFDSGDGGLPFAVTGDGGFLVETEEVSIHGDAGASLVGGYGGGTSIDGAGSITERIGSYLGAQKWSVESDSGSPLLSIADDGTIDAHGNRITNGADGVDPTDFATVEQVTAGAGVTSLDSIVGAVTLVAGAGIAIADDTPSPGEITISTSGVAGGPFTRGSSTVTYAASSLSATVTITHGLGATPAAISLQGVDGVSALGLEVIAGSVNATTFQCRGFDTKGTSRTGTQSFYWVAYA